VTSRQAFLKVRPNVVEPVFRRYHFQLMSSSTFTQLDVSFLARVAMSGECLRGEGLVRLIGAVVCLLAA